LAALALVSPLLGQFSDTPRRRIQLPNGALILVEQMPKAKRLSVCLAVSAVGTYDTPKTHGYRHLLEHLIAKGSREDLDARLESAGSLLTAQTQRDLMLFQVDVSNEQLDIALRAVLEMARPSPITVDRIAKEVRIIGQEIALKEADRELSGAGWRAGFGDARLEPLGDLATMATATPEGLSDLHERMFSASNLVVSVAGNIDADRAMKVAVGLFSPLLKGGKADRISEPKWMPGRVTADAYGDARCALIPPLSNPKSVWTLAAGLAVAAGLSDGFVTMTPSPRTGLIAVGQTGDRVGANLAFDEANGTSLFALGRRLARSWVASQTGTPSALARIKAVLAVGGGRPEMLGEALDQMTYEDFVKGLAAFRREDSVVVVGDR
jgi:hypothetical protein